MGRHNYLHESHTMRKFVQEVHTSATTRSAAEANYDCIRDVIHEFNLVEPEWVTTYGPSSITLKRRNGTMIRVDVYGTIFLDVKLKTRFAYKSSVYKHPTCEAALPKIRKILGAYAPKLTV